MDRLRLATAVILLSALAAGGCSSRPADRARAEPNAAQARPYDAAAAEAANSVYFEAGKSELNADSRRRLEGWATALRRQPNLRFTIIGHGDGRTTRDYGIALGAERAEAVKNYLVALGVDERQLFTTSYGKESPAAPAPTVEAQAHDSRATVVVESIAAVPVP
ncbi:MAG TPA: OmpA family protein [Alphaproteobacteria bacterium]